MMGDTAAESCLLTADDDDDELAVYLRWSPSAWAMIIVFIWNGFMVSAGGVCYTTAGPGGQVIAAKVEPQCCSRALGVTSASPKSLHSCRTLPSSLLEDTIRYR